MQEAVEKIIKALVNEPDAASVRAQESERATVFEVRVGGDDMGRIIGRDGRTIKAVRSVLYAAGQKHGRRFVLDVVEE